MNTIREKGIRNLFGIAFNRVVPAWMFRVRRFNVYELCEQDHSDKQNSHTNVDIGWCETEEEAKAVELITGPQRDVVFVGEAYMRACYIKVKGEFAGGLWVTSKHFVESGLGVAYELGPKQCWLFGASIEKQHRRKGLYSRLLHFVTGTMSGGGNQLFAAVNPDNIGSRIVHEKFAKRKVGRIVAASSFGLAMCIARGDISVDRTIARNNRISPILIRFDSCREVVAPAET